MDNAMDVTHVPYRIAAAYLQQRLESVQGLSKAPRVGIICGSGLSELSNTFEEPRLTVSYADIPGFPAHCTVAGHKGEVVFGVLAGVPAMCFRGRFHSYEGHDMKTVVLPVYVMRCLNVQVCIVTNAAGGLNPDYAVGDVVAVSDHLAIPQLAGNNPLVGPNDDELGPRFPATSNAYDADLRKITERSAHNLGMASFLHAHGTYCFVSGPMYESKAECRLLRSLGGDMVGMSTIPEIVAAHHCNMKTLCLSLITNKVIMTGDEGAPIATHAEVLEAVATRSTQMQNLVHRIVAILQTDFLPTLTTLPIVSLVVTDTLHQSFHANRQAKSFRNSRSRSSNWGNNNTINNNLGNSSWLGSNGASILIGCALVGAGVILGIALQTKSKNGHRTTMRT